MFSHFQRLSQKRIIAWALWPSKKCPDLPISAQMARNCPNWSHCRQRQRQQQRQSQTTVILIRLKSLSVGPMASLWKSGSVDFLFPSALVASLEAARVEFDPQVWQPAPWIGRWGRILQFYKCTHLKKSAEIQTHANNSGSSLAISVQGINATLI